jgi:hypothetical protein
MIPFGDEAVTLYNRRETKDEATGRTAVSWIRTALTKCSWARRIERVRDGTAYVLAESIVCRIPESNAYRAPEVWDALTSTTGLFTLAPGDIIVRGTVTDTIGPALTSAALVDKHRRGGVMTVASATDNTRPGCLTGHYLARGA